MIILEKPYVSEFLVESIIQNNWTILDNDACDLLNYEKRAFNIMSNAAAKDYCKQFDYPIMYSNSENSIDWVMENLPKSQLARMIRIFKNKARFRDIIWDMYPNFFYKEMSFEELTAISLEDLKFPFVVKPCVGFLGLGVHVIQNDTDWKHLLNSLEGEMLVAKNLYPASVIESSKFLMEEYVDGEEFAIDAYYNKDGQPVILNIYQHPISDSKDTRKRVYMMSVGIMIKYMSRIALLLKNIGDKNCIKNLPFHMEVRITENNEIIPIEVNPMRFAGWCASDVAKYAWGINVYEYFIKQEMPDWNEILSESKRGVYYFTIAEVPSGFDRKRIKSFDYKKFLSNFSNVIEFRQINYKNNPVFAVIFGHTEDKNEIKQILDLRTKDFINYS